METLPLVVPAIWRRSLEAYRSLGLSAWITGAALCSLMVLALFPWPSRYRRYARAASAAAMAWVVVLSLSGAWRLSWLCDDAFISFRYARNLVDGHGLVFNIGERVEGYTNFLWTVLMAAGVAARVHPGQLAIVLGLASFGGALALSWRVAMALSTRRSPPTVSIAAVLLGGSYTFASYATSGLETMLGTTLVLLSLERALRHRPLAAGLAGLAAVLTRPDHAIFYVGLAAAMALERSRRRELVRFLAPFGLIYVPYFLARWAWYGELLPNTFHAKSGAESYLGQGIVYLIACALGSGLFGLIPLAAAGIAHLRRHLLTRFVLLSVPIYLFYVARIGGDFMLGRLLVPVLPLFAVLAEAGARRLAAFRRAWLAVVGVVSATAFVLPVRLIPASEKMWNIADERTFYPVKSFSPLYVDSPFWAWADDLIATYGTGPDTPRIATGCVGIVGYRTMAPMLDIFGLTDRQVARQPLASRGRPGHEKRAAPSLLLDRHVTIADVDVWPAEYLPLFQLPSGRIPVRLVRWEPRFAHKARSANPSSIPDLPSYLLQYHAPAGDPDRFACDLWFFEDFYFSQAPGERLPFLDRLVNQGDIDAFVAPFYRVAMGDSPPGWVVAGRLALDDDSHAAWIATGSAFRAWPVLQTPANQDAVGHASGAFLDSYTDAEGDRAVGAIQSPPFELRGDVVTVRVAGGNDRARLAAMLVVDGHIIAAATGCKSEILSRRVWDVRPWRGMQARLVVVDDSDNGWGHIIVNDVVQWERAR
jgi:hypothetical protein